MRVACFLCNGNEKWYSCGKYTMHCVMKKIFLWSALFLLTKRVIYCGTVDNKATWYFYDAAVRGDLIPWFSSPLATDNHPLMFTWKENLSLLQPSVCRCLLLVQMFSGQESRVWQRKAVGASWLAGEWVFFFLRFLPSSSPFPSLAAKSPNLVRNWKTNWYLLLSSSKGIRFPPLAWIKRNPSFWSESADFPYFVDSTISMKSVNCSFDALLASLSVIGKYSIVLVRIYFSGTGDLSLCFFCSVPAKNVPWTWHSFKRYSFSFLQ